MTQHMLQFKKLPHFTVRGDKNDVWMLNHRANVFDFNIMKEIKKEVEKITNNFVIDSDGDFIEACKIDVNTPQCNAVYLVPFKHPSDDLQSKSLYNPDKEERKLLAKKKVIPCDIKELNKIADCQMMRRFNVIFIAGVAVYLVIVDRPSRYKFADHNVLDIEELWDLMKLKSVHILSPRPGNVKEFKIVYDGVPNFIDIGKISFFAVPYKLRLLDTGQVRVPKLKYSRLRAVISQVQGFPERK